jgi:ATP-dependent protease ClpP protease subunit
VNAQNLRDAADKLESYERVVRATMKAHTHLTDAETLTYVRRTVILNSDDARRDGVIDAIADFTVPKDVRGYVIAVKPTAPAPRPATPPAPN